jgi:tRNA modification GTPase
MLLPDTTQTIVAPASPPGSGAISVVRLSGPDAIKIASSFLKPSSVSGNPKARFPYLLNAFDSGRLLDKTVTVFYRAPGSYTGDDMVEISCHGSPYIVASLLRLSIANGAREARPGEFTLRAFLHGKLDLAQAEGINDLIISEGEAAHRAAITQVEGEVSSRVKKLRGTLIGLLSELEVRLDDSYNELPALDLRVFAGRTRAAAAEIKTLADSFEKGRLAKHGVRVTITGAPNSGKSSLLNRLIGSRRAIVSPQAGTTRDTIEARLNLSGFTVLFTDTAGISPRAAGALEREGMRRSLKAIKTADIIVWVLDGSRTNSAADLRAGRAIERCALQGSDVIKVFNKSDLPPARAAEGTAGGTAVSCKTGAGLAALKRRILKDEKKIFTAESSAVITSARHYSALLNAHKELSRLDTGGGPKTMPFELAAEHLKAALAALSDILGETTADDILENIFKNFCVGK